MLLNAPGKSVTIHPSRGTPLAAFIFWSPEISSGFDHFDSEQHKRIVGTTFADIGWKVPEILDAVRASRELYCNSVSRVELMELGTGTNCASGRLALIDIATWGVTSSSMAALQAVGRRNGCRANCIRRQP